MNRENEKKVYLVIWQDTTDYDLPIYNYVFSTKAKAEKYRQYIWDTIYTAKYIDNNNPSISCMVVDEWIKKNI